MQSKLSGHWESKGLNNDILKYEAKELNECLSRFFAEICKRWLRLSAGQTKGYFSCNWQTSQT